MSEISSWRFFLVTLECKLVPILSWFKKQAVELNKLLTNIKRIFDQSGNIKATGKSKIMLTLLYGGGIKTRENNKKQLNRFFVPLKSNLSRGPKCVHNH